MHPSHGHAGRDSGRSKWLRANDPSSRLSRLLRCAALVVTTWTLENWVSSAPAAPAFMSHDLLPTTTTIHARFGKLTTARSVKIPVSSCRRFGRYRFSLCHCCHVPLDLDLSTFFFQVVKGVSMVVLVIGFATAQQENRIRGNKATESAGSHSSANWEASSTHSAIMLSY
jgi:hypothetical protein